MAVRRPAGITVLTILFALAGFLLLLPGGAAMALGGAFAKGFAGGFEARLSPGSLGASLVVVSLLILVLAGFLWRGAGWARVIWRGLLSLHFGITAYTLGMGLYTTREIPAGLASALLSMGVDLVLLGVLRSEAVARYCSR